VLQAATGPADPRIANAGAYLAWHGADPLHFQEDGGRSAEAGADLYPDPALAGRGANHKPGAGSKTGSDAVWRRVPGQLTRACWDQCRQLPAMPAPVSKVVEQLRVRFNVHELYSIATIIGSDIQFQQFQQRW